MKCKETCKYYNEKCFFNECKYWIDFEEDLNCSLISIEKNGSMSLEKVSKRLQPLTPQNIHYIQKKAQNKISKSKILNTIYQ